MTQRYFPPKFLYYFVAVVFIVLMVATSNGAADAILFVGFLWWLTCIDHRKGAG